jgi:hypothetical protein
MAGSARQRPPVEVAASVGRQLQAAALQAAVAASAHQQRQEMAVPQAGVAASPQAEAEAPQAVAVAW